MLDPGQDEKPVPSRPSRILRFLDVLEPFAQRHRFSVNVAIHSLLFFVALLLAFLVRFDAGGLARGDNWFFGKFLLWLPLFVGLKLLIFGKMKRVSASLPVFCWPPCCAC
jgi:hypothetical protein